MRPDHTATDFVPHQSLLASPLKVVDDESEPTRQMSVFTRVTFCFARLFGLEPCLTGAVNEQRAPSAVAADVRYRTDRR
ncbi:hypothetical protein [Paraburkholderia fungorum]|uniref:hypothetical protein n=1 Tax=Paraburkholderia fungorum TaxID=134537 RepID=UPI0038B9FA20